MRYVWACAAVAGFLLVCLLVSRPTVVSGQDKQKARPVWEYKVLNGIDISKYGGANSPEEGLNKLGKDGWDLVTVTPGVPSPGSLAQYDKDGDKATIKIAMLPFYYLKREAK
jgi:hypothetical protein